MAIDLTKFIILNVADTCAAWNILSSNLLFSAARERGCHFCITGYVEYECLIKERSKPDAPSEDLKKRLLSARSGEQFKAFSLDLEDLLEVEILEKRKNLGKGELSSIAFAKRTQQAFITDDQSARKLAAQVLGASRVQTTPHLLGWLLFIGCLPENCKEAVLKEHSSFGRPLGTFFEDVHSLAMRYRKSSQ